MGCDASIASRATLAWVVVLKRGTTAGDAAVSQCTAGSGSADPAARAEDLSRCASELESKNAYAEAEAAWKQGAEILKRELGPESADLAEYLGGLAMFYQRRGRQVDARELFDRRQGILNAVDKTLKETGIETILDHWKDLQHLRRIFLSNEWTVLNNLVTDRESYGTDNHPLVQQRMARVGRAYFLRSDWRNAVILYSRVAAAETVRRQLFDTPQTTAVPSQGITYLAGLSRARLRQIAQK